MNRRHFFKTLGLGILSAPAIAKAISETAATPVPYGAMLIRRCDPITGKGDYEWSYKGIIYRLDQHPLRFSQ